jgi:hypothetical protein
MTKEEILGIKGFVSIDNNPHKNIFNVTYHRIEIIEGLKIEHTAKFFFNLNNNKLRVYGVDEKADKLITPIFVGIIKTKEDLVQLIKFLDL